MQLQQLEKADVEAVLDTYFRAWVEQDPELILTIFTPTGSYHERVLEAPILGHDGIRAYWQDKVVGAEANIEARLLNLYLDGSTAVAEWEAAFDDVIQGTRKQGRWVAILEFDGQQIQHFREYWSVRSA
jgi:SnoaL-like protein